MYHLMLKLNQMTKSVKSVKEAGCFSGNQNRRTYNSGAVLEKLSWPFGNKVFGTLRREKHAGEVSLLKEMAYFKETNNGDVSDWMRVNCFMETYYSWINERWRRKRWRWTWNKIALVVTNIIVIVSWIPLSARRIVWSEDYCRGTSINRLCSKELLTLPCRMVWFFIQDHSVGFANTRKQDKANYLIFI